MFLYNRLNFYTAEGNFGGYRRINGTWTGMMKLFQDNVILTFIYIHLIF